MVNEDIVGGLKAALARGESLKQAMMSFYRAGYKKEDIEWAARSLHMQEPQRPRQTLLKRPKQGLIRKPKPVVTQKIKRPEHSVSQKVSNYGKSKKPKGKLIIILLIFFLLVLLGVLAGIFLFKEELVEFFDKLFF